MINKITQGLSSFIANIKPSKRTSTAASPETQEFFIKHTIGTLLEKVKSYLPSNNTPISAPSLALALKSIMTEFMASDAGQLLSANGTAQLLQQVLRQLDMPEAVAAAKQNIARELAASSVPLARANSLASISDAVAAAPHTPTPCNYHTCMQQIINGNSVKLKTLTDSLGDLFETNDLKHPELLKFQKPKGAFGKIAALLTRKKRKDAKKIADTVDKTESEIVSKHNDQLADGLCKQQEITNALFDINAQLAAENTALETENAAIIDEKFKIHYALIVAQNELATLREALHKAGEFDPSSQRSVPASHVATSMPHFPPVGVGDPELLERFLTDAVKHSRLSTETDVPPAQIPMPGRHTTQAPSVEAPIPEPLAQPAPTPTQAATPTPATQSAPESPLKVSIAAQDDGITLTITQPKASTAPIKWNDKIDKLGKRLIAQEAAASSAATAHTQENAPSTKVADQEIDAAYSTLHKKLSGLHNTQQKNQLKNFTKSLKEIAKYCKDKPNLRQQFIKLANNTTIDRQYVDQQLKKTYVQLKNKPAESENIEKYFAELFKATNSQTTAEQSAPVTAPVAQEEAAPAIPQSQSTTETANIHHALNEDDLQQASISQAQDILNEYIDPEILNKITNFITKNPILADEYKAFAECIRDHLVSEADTNKAIDCLSTIADHGEKYIDFAKKILDPNIYYVRDDNILREQLSAAIETATNGLKKIIANETALTPQHRTASFTRSTLYQPSKRATSHMSPRSANPQRSATSVVQQPTVEASTTKSLSTPSTLSTELAQTVAGNTPTLNERVIGLLSDNEDIKKKIGWINGTKETAAALLEKSYQTDDHIKSEITQTYEEMNRLTRGICEHIIKNLKQQKTIKFNYKEVKLIVDTYIKENIFDYADWEKSMCQIKPDESSSSATKQEPTTVQISFKRSSFAEAIAQASDQPTPAPNDKRSVFDALTKDLPDYENSSKTAKHAKILMQKLAKDGNPISNELALIVASVAIHSMGHTDSRKRCSKSLDLFDHHDTILALRDHLYDSQKYGLPENINADALDTCIKQIKQYYAKSNAQSMPVALDSDTSAMQQLPAAAAPATPSSSRTRKKVTFLSVDNFNATGLAAITRKLNGGGNIDKDVANALALAPKIMNKPTKELYLVLAAALEYNPSGDQPLAEALSKDEIQITPQEIAAVGNMFHAITNNQEDILQQTYETCAKTIDMTKLKAAFDTVTKILIWVPIPKETPQ